MSNKLWTAKDWEKSRREFAKRKQKLERIQFEKECWLAFETEEETKARLTFEKRNPSL
jgi:hypothetical protein